MTTNYLDIKDWIPAATFAYNSAVSESTGFTPNYLLLGFEPSTRSLFNLVDLDAKPSSQLFREQRRLQAFKIASTKILQAHNSAKLYEAVFEPKQTPRKCGDRILIKNHTVPTWISQKMIPPYYPAENGIPFEVVHVKDNNQLEIVNPATNQRTQIHSDETRLVPGGTIYPLPIPKPPNTHPDYPDLTPGVKRMLRKIKKTTGLAAKAAIGKENKNSNKDWPQEKRPKTENPCTRNAD